jgi:hypothetical protein
VTGHRKILVFFGGLSFLLVGLLFCLAWEAAGAVLFSPYATGVGVLAALAIGGNVGEHLAKRGAP